MQTEGIHHLSVVWLSVICVDFDVMCAMYGHGGAVCSDYCLSIFPLLLMFFLSILPLGINESMLWT